MPRSLLLVGALLALAAYLSSTYLPSNQLTVHRGSAKLLPMPLTHPFGFTLKYLSSGDLQLSKAEAYLRASTADPVVFVHGHAGNVKQAISLTRFLLKQNLHVDVFSLDYLEGKSALSHRLLEEESEFLNKSLRYIAELYPQKQITIIAHSMGGVVTSLALALKGAPVDKVSLLVALSTPFESHPLNLSPAWTGLYKRMHEFWLDPAHDHIFVLSLTGGVRDLTVPPSMTNVMELQHKNSLHLYTTQIEGLHLEADHLAIVWGKEFFERLALFLSRALKDTRGAVKQIAIDVLMSPLATALTADPARVEAKASHEARIEFAGSGLTALVCRSKQSVIAEDGLELVLDWTFIDNHWFTVVKASVISLPLSHSCQLYPVPLFSDLSFLKAELIGSSLKIPEHTYAVHVTPGPEFFNPRYPLHLTVHGEGQIRAVFAQCASEQIIKYNEHDFILYFNEVCPQGPDIWLIGFDTEFPYNLELRVDWPGRLILMFRDFRVLIGSLAGAWILCAHAPDQRIILISFAVLAVVGNQVRQYGMLLIDHVHDVPLWLGPIDVVYLMLCSLFISKAFENLLILGSKAFSLVRRQAPSVTRVAPVTVIMLWLCPTLIYLWGLLLVLLYKPSAKSQHFMLACLIFNLSLPIEAYLLAKEHGASLALDQYEWGCIAVYIASATAILLDKTEVHDSLRAACAVYIVVFAQDLVYRANFAITAVALCAALSLLLKTAKAKA